MDARLSSLAERTASLSEVDMSNRKREKEEEPLGCFSRLFSYYYARKERRICIYVGKKAPMKEQKCEHDNGFYDAKLPSSELQSTCALCILFFLSSSRRPL